MSDSMQRPSCRGSRSAGRLRLSTSCHECHRRKQKCDQKQPCKNCSRRYPPPQCVYRRRELSSNQVLASSNSAEVGAASKMQDTYVSEYAPDLGQIGDQVLGCESLSSWDMYSPPSAASLQHDVLRFEDSTLAVAEAATTESLDLFDPVSAYQRLLTTMVFYPYEDVNNELAIFETEEGNDNIDPSLQNFVGVQRLRWHYQDTGGPPSRFSISSVDPLHYLPITPNIQNGQLFNIFVKLITKYVVSIDGNPSPNYYNDFWVPWAIKSPLLAQVGIYTAACYQAESQKIPAGQSTVALGYKLESIELLNQMLRSEDSSTCDDALAAVIYLITNEWYWGINENVQAHLAGLRSMMALRGGLECEINQFLRQMIILCDYHMACSFDCEPSFPHKIIDQGSYPVCMSTPLLPSKNRFADHLEELHISKETAIILDDMRFLISSIFTLNKLSPSEQDLTKLFATSTWIRDRIVNLSDPTTSSPDFIYRSCRLAALIYCKAILYRIPLSRVCSLEDLKSLWEIMWRITLTEWKQLPGVFMWIILSAHQAAQDTAYGRFLKSMLKASSFFITLENWDVVDGALMGFVGLQRWLRRGSEKCLRGLDHVAGS